MKKILMLPSLKLAVCSKNWPGPKGQFIFQPVIFTGENGSCRCDMDIPWRRNASFLFKAKVLGIFDAEDNTQPYLILLKEECPMQKEIGRLPASVK